jgi:hypothetical protein
MQKTPRYALFSYKQGATLSKEPCIVTLDWWVVGLKMIGWCMALGGTFGSWGRKREGAHGERIPKLGRVACDDRRNFCVGKEEEITGREEIVEEEDA